MRIQINLLNINPRFVFFYDFFVTESVHSACANLFEKKEICMHGVILLDIPEVYIDYSNNS